MTKVAILIAAALSLAVACAASSEAAQPERPAAPSGVASSPVATDPKDTATAGPPDTEDSANITATPRPTATPLEVIVPPCIPFPGSEVDPCEVRDYFDTFTPNIEASIEIPEVVDTIESRWLERVEFPFWATHFVVRATVIPGSTRCGPSAQGINHWLAYALQTSPPSESRSSCYVDLAVNEYIIGQGPASLTVITGPNPNDFRDGNCDEQCRVEGARRVKNTGIEGVEWVFFLGGPRHLGQGALEIESEFDVQRHHDGTVVVAHRYKGVILAHSQPENYAMNASRVEQPLDEFRMNARNAYAAFVELTGGLTGTANDWEGRPPPKLSNDAGTAGYNDFMARTGLIQGTPVPPPSIPDEDDLFPNGLTIDDIIATRVAGGTAP